MIDEQVILSTLGIFKIKYNILDKLNIKKIHNIHIDLNTIFSPLYKLNDIFDNDNISFKFTISSAILNLVAHFKYYSIKNNYSIKNIYLYYSYPKSNKKENINKQIIDSIELISIIVKYLPNIYLIDDKSLDIKLSMDYFMENKDLLITKNLIYYQFLTKNITILRPSRDDSYLITSDNLYNKLSNSDNKFNISNSLLSAILSFSGVNEFKGFKGMGIKKTIKLFDNSIKDNKIINEYYPSISSLLSDLGYRKYDNEVIKAFENIDLKLCKLTKISKTSYDSICQSYIIDKFANKDLKELNTKYFTGFNSLMLKELLMENKSKNKIKW